MGAAQVEKSCQFHRQSLMLFPVKPQTLKNPRQTGTIRVAYYLKHHSYTEYREIKKATRKRGLSISNRKKALNLLK
jgi:hypothetical protein